MMRLTTFHGIDARPREATSEPRAEHIPCVICWVNSFLVTLAITALALILLTGCGKKPVTTVGAVAGCGPMPPPVMLCVETLPLTSNGDVDQNRITQADLKRCYVNTVDELIAENKMLRIKYAPCAK